MFFDFSLCFDFLKFHFITKVEYLILIFDLFPFALIHQSHLILGMILRHTTRRVLNNATKNLHSLHPTWIPLSGIQQFLDPVWFILKGKHSPVKLIALCDTVYDYFHYPWECGIRRRKFLFRILVCQKLCHNQC